MVAPSEASAVGPLGRLALGPEGAHGDSAQKAPYAQVLGRASGGGIGTARRAVRTNLLGCSKPRTGGIATSRQSAEGS